MFKKMIYLTVFILSICLFSQAPGFIYKYHAVLEGEYIALSRDYSFYVSEAKKYGETLEEFFDGLSALGNRALSVAEYERSNIERLIFLQNQKTELDKNSPYISLKVMFFEVDKEIFDVALENFHFEVPLGMSNNWIITTILLSIISTFLMFMSFSFLKP